MQRCENAIAIDRETLSLILKWKGARDVNEGTRPEALAADRKLDTSLGAFHRRLVSDADAFEGQPAGDAANAILRRVFPDGSGDIIREEHETQVGLAEEIVGLLRGSLAPHVKTLGAESYVDLISAHVDEFRAALGKVDTREVTYDQVRASDEAGQEAMIRVVIGILHQFDSNSESDVEARADLMEPILLQNRRIGDYYARRRAVPDVDPETGEESDEPTIEDSGDGPGSGGSLT